ncbi:MAG: phosphate ABC transporter substrate-binding protein [Planctomycetes bacterium]|nr:phosphate ABC transporter substrate-binding protein [Planctomycetota bacterium]
MNKFFHRGVAAIFSASFLMGLASAQQMKVDKELPSFKPTPNVKYEGRLSAVGSDTMINVMNLWGEAFKKHHPEVRIQVEGKGSSTAPPALIEGTSQFGPMSRAMKDAEKDAFIKKFGYEPFPVRTSLDALAVFVNKNNPVASMTMEQVDAIFSKARKLGHGEDITTWGQLGLGGDWFAARLSLYGRNSASGTYGYFKKVALGKGDYKDTVKEQPGSAGVVNSISSDEFGVGYSGIGYLTSSVRAVPLSVDGEEYFEASLANVVSGDYPLGRFLYVYINKNPKKALDPVQAEFLRFVFSKEGQEIVIKSGYLPITAGVAERECKSLGIPFQRSKKTKLKPLQASAKSPI